MENEIKPIKLCKYCEQPTKKNPESKSGHHCKATLVYQIAYKKGYWDAKMEDQE